MLLIDSTRPTSGQFVLQWFRFTNTREGLALDFANESDNPESLGSVLLNPPSQILEGSGVKF